jgi:hypothetical protein
LREISIQRKSYNIYSFNKQVVIEIITHHTEINNRMFHYEKPAQLPNIVGFSPDEKNYQKINEGHKKNHLSNINYPSYFFFTFLSKVTRHQHNVHITWV